MEEKEYVNTKVVTVKARQTGTKCRQVTNLNVYFTLSEPDITLLVACHIIHEKCSRDLVVLQMLKEHLTILLSRFLSRVDMLLKRLFYSIFLNYLFN